MTFLCQYIHSILSSLAQNCCWGLADLKMMLESLNMEGCSILLLIEFISR